MVTSSGGAVGGRALRARRCDQLSRQWPAALWFARQGVEHPPPVCAEAGQRRAERFGCAADGTIVDGSESAPNRPKGPGKKTLAHLVQVHRAVKQCKRVARTQRSPVAV